MLLFVVGRPSISEPWNFPLKEKTMTVLVFLVSYIPFNSIANHKKMDLKMTMEREGREMTKWSKNSVAEFFAGFEKKTAEGFKRKRFVWLILS